ncbi:hypothetical protein DYB31_001636 [Aphanomyces astaci]|uniref:DNA alkylation repair enzyme n=1 Tax=Aphanomyces astaci TaxID=112090 RepID=A0A397F9T3_APHAT|nr:hypothetical protein DYB31_001636 [Aphanomyces astaci]
MPTLRSKVTKQIAASSSLLRCLEGLVKPSYAKQAEKFVHRSYCPHDIFVGIRVPQCREAVKTHLAATTLNDVVDLLHDARHEMRLTGFIALTEAFLRPTTTSWWSDTDDVVPVDDHIKQLGMYTRLSLAIDLLPAWYQRLLRSNDLWETRISIVLLLKVLPTEHCPVAYAICLYHINKFHADPLLRCTIRGVPFESLDLIHKALGWILREAGKHDPARLTQFLHEHAAKAFKTTVRYATEHMSRPKAKRFLDVAQRGVGGSDVAVAPLLLEE